MAKLIGRYEISEELGRGGMSTVYVAFDPKLHREVALKLMDQQLTTEPSFVARFEREARTIAALEHNAIVSIYDFGEFDSWLYLVMPYMKGGSLKEQIARGPLSPEQSYDVVRRIGSALDKAHSKNIIHRDLKPGNILLDEEQEAYLTDFGIVKVAKGDTEYLTQTGQTIGTFAYMSPEQLMGETLDGRSDLYALGIVLYEMLTGKHPYGDETTTDAAMAVAHTQAPIPDVTEDNSDLPPAFAGVIRKVLAKTPADRYATGRELSEAIAEALTAQASHPSPATAMPTKDELAPELEDQQEMAPVVAGKTERLADKSERPAVAASQGENGELPAAISPLPRWAVWLVGIATIIAAMGAVVASDILFDQDFVVFYWLIIGLLIGATILTRPADWRWRLTAGILGIFSFIITFLTYDQLGLLLPAIAGIIIGLVLGIQAFRGGGKILAVFGVASVILGLLTLLLTS